MSESLSESTSDASGTAFRRMFIKVIAAEVFVLLMLGLLQSRYSR